MTTIMTNEEIIRMAREALEKLESWVNGYAQDYVPNDVFHNTGGFIVMENARDTIAALRSALTQPQGEDDLTIAYMVGYEKGKDEAKEKAAKVCEKEMQAWINFDEDCHEASAIKKCAAAIRSMK